MRAFFLAALLALTSACVATVPQQAPLPAPVQQSQLPPEARRLGAVVERVMPVAVGVCERQTPRRRCDFFVALDDSTDIEANAFQTLARDGRPVIGFTLPLVQQTRNEDELALILAHEAAHHIAGHIARGQASARLGADLIGGLIAASGGDATAVREAQGFGAFLGARRYAQEFELEADALGALIAREAGYDPLRGVLFFQNAPDPGAEFLGTHPPNARRVEVIRGVLAAN